MWGIYDELIASLPTDLKVEEFLAGLNWFLVRSKAGVGMTMTPREGIPYLSLMGKTAGMSVKEGAQLVKSWNFYDAAMGLAAINSVSNAPETVEKTFRIKLEEQPKENVFEWMKEQLRGKKVAVIGHFRDLEALAPICQLSILERCPLDGDYPDPACEYILPQQDYVFITATTLINKTLPRLLELSRNAYVALVGPSAPLNPRLFKYGIDMLAGTVIVDGRQAWDFIQEGGNYQFFDHGAQMVKVTAAEWKGMEPNGGF